ncbi:hypothetical protein ACFL57_05030 [Candidatus Margulisiibacteriota bacterium]
MKKTIINILILISISFAVYAASSSGTISVIVPERYTLSFDDTAGIDFSIADDQTGSEVGQLSIDSSTSDPLHFMFHCDNNNYIDSNTSYLVLDSGSIDNASDRMPFQVYFPTTPGSSLPDDIPNSAETAAAVSDTQNSNSVVFSVKAGYLQGMNIVIDKADMKKAKNASYTSEITITVADT